MRTWKSPVSGEVFSEVTVYEVKGRRVIVGVNAAGVTFIQYEDTILFDVPKGGVDS